LFIFFLQLEADVPAISGPDFQDLERVFFFRNDGHLLFDLLPGKTAQSDLAGLDRSKFIYIPGN